jgi:hypothetical protein
MVPSQLNSRLGFINLGLTLRVFCVAGKKKDMQISTSQYIEEHRREFFPSETCHQHSPTIVMGTEANQDSDCQNPQPRASIAT